MLLAEAQRTQRSSSEARPRARFARGVLCVSIGVGASGLFLGSLQHHQASFERLPNSWPALLLDLGNLLSQ